MAIGFCTDQQDFQPVIGVPAIVAQKLRKIAAIIDGDVDVAVISCSPRRQRPDRSVLPRPRWLSR